METLIVEIENESNGYFYEVPRTKILEMLEMKQKDAADAILSSKAFAIYHTKMIDLYFDNMAKEWWEKEGKKEWKEYLNLEGGQR